MTYQRPKTHSILLAALVLSFSCVASRAETLRLAVHGGLASLDPHVLNETFSIGILSNVMEGLVRRDHKLRILPGLATHWQQLTPMRWRLHLRRGVRFHDGSEFSADDVVFSFNRARQPLSQQKGRIPDGARIERVNRHTIDIHLVKPNPILPADWEALLIMSKSWSQRHGLAQAGATHNPSNMAMPANGTGPYRVVHHRAGVTTRFVANRDWWGRHAYEKGRHLVFQHVNLHTVRTALTRTAALLNGQVDLIVPAPIQDMDRIMRSEGFKSVQGPELRTIFLNMDQFRDTPIGSLRRVPNPLRDQRVRLAIYHAIDVETIRRVVMRGNAVVATSLLSPIVHPGVRYIKRHAYDPARARVLLRDAGYPNGFTLPMDCPNDRYVNDGEICQAIAGMLAHVGIRVPLNIQTKSLFFSKVLSGGGYNSSFNLIGWTPGLLDGWNVLANLARCRDAKGHGARFNLGGYCNPKVDRLTDNALVELDLGRRARMMTEAFQLIHDDVGFIPLHQQTLSWAMSDRISAKVRADNQIRFRLIRKQDKRRIAGG